VKTVGAVMAQAIDEGFFPSGRRPFCFLGGMAILLGLVVATAAPAHSRTWYIKADGTGDAPTIQAGVDSAATGDTVLVAPGTYSDTTYVNVNGSVRPVNVYVYKNVNVIGESVPPGATIDGSASEVAIYAEHVDSSVAIRRFKVQTTFDGYFCVDGGSGNTTAKELEPDFDIGILCQSSSVLIEENELVDNGIAVALDDSPARVTNNEIYRSFWGIDCTNSSNATISGNNIHECAAMIRCEDSAPLISDNAMWDGCTAVSCRTNSAPHIVNNHISRTSPRAIVCGEASPTIESNLFSENRLAIFLSSFTRTPVVRGNVFYDHSGTVIDLTDNPSAVIENNTIDKAIGYAIVCQATSNPVLRGNIIVRTGGGISCALASTPTIECNNIFDVEDLLYAGLCSDQTGINGNISVDPEFCGVADSGNYLLQSDSPCAPGNHPDAYDCGIIGAKEVGCGTVSTTRGTWGHLKGRYFKEGEK
jgi:hypothetical protein